MLSNDTLTSRILDTLLGALIFFIVVAVGTYYLQSSLIIYKHYGAYTHWAVVLIGTPLIAGLIMRLARLYYPLISAVLGATATAAFLYPFYQVFWAEPPTITDLIIYVAVVLGIGFTATQPLRTTFMIAFRLGRFAVPKLGKGDKGSARKVSTAKGKTTAKEKTAAKGTAKGKAATTKSSMTKTQRLQVSDYGNVIAMMELVVGVTSLVLSVISIFFLGGG